MSLWTPSGEHPVGKEPPSGAAPGGQQAPPSGSPPGGDADGPDVDVDELRRQLATAPPEVVVANHCYGLFELAAVYLSQQPPLLPQAQLAIDALGYMVDGLGDRLGEARGSLSDALAQIRLAFVELSAAEQARQTQGNGS
jgi:hypothetical protein